jgi:hypothetical protein
MIAFIVKWFIVTLYALGTLSTIASIGKPRQPVTNGQAMVIILFNALIVIAVITWWQA